MEIDKVERVARLVRQRNALEEQLSREIGRPALRGHLGEWLAEQIFGIRLEKSAAAKAIDGRFGAGALEDKTVNVKFYGKREGLLDLTTQPGIDFYLVFAGPPAAAVSSRGATRPSVISRCYLFDAHQLHAEQVRRGVGVGIASSVPAPLWDQAELYPTNRNRLLEVTPEQQRLLALFAPTGG